MWLQEKPEDVNAALAPALGSARTAIVAIRPEKDLSRLARTHPDVAAFKLVPNCIDSTVVWKRFWQKAPNPVMVRRSSNISALARSLTGKDLDKTMQVRFRNVRPKHDAAFRLKLMYGMAYNAWRALECCGGLLTA